MKVDFKIYDVTVYLTNNYNTYISQYLKKQRKPDNEIWCHSIEYYKINIFLQKTCTKRGRVTSSRPQFVFKKAL